MIGEDALVNKVVGGDTLVSGVVVSGALVSGLRGDGGIGSEVSETLPDAAGVAAFFGVLLKTGADFTDVGELLDRS